MRGQWGILAAALMLTACDQQEPKAAAPRPSANEEFGRFTVVQAGTSASGQAFAWRLDTKTGDLEFCYYDPGGMLSKDKLLGASLNCSTSAKELFRTHL